jgi:hypothetical protein
VIQVAEELIEAMHRRQMLVAVSEVILAKLPGGIALDFSTSASVTVCGCKPCGLPTEPTVVSPERIGNCPVMKAARPAVQPVSQKGEKWDKSSAEGSPGGRHPATPGGRWCGAATARRDTGAWRQPVIVRIAHR